MFSASINLCLVYSAVLSNPDCGNRQNVMIKRMKDAIKNYTMELFNAFDEINKYTHMWNWAPDWDICKRIYLTFPDSYSVLTPFAYSYLEELIRSTTSEYGRALVDKSGNLKKHRKVGTSLINLAIEENKFTKPDYVKILHEIKPYFSHSEPTDIGDNRNSVHHGYMHPRFWEQESFEKLIIDIARLSKFAGF